MSDFSSSPLIHTVREITDQNAPQPQWSWDLRFKVLPESGMDFQDSDLARTPEEKEGFFIPVAFTNLDFLGDFETGFCDPVTCSITVAAG